MQINTPKHLHHIVNGLSINRRNDPSTALDGLLLCGAYIPRLWLHLLQKTLATTTAHSSRVDALGVAAEGLRAVDTRPHVLEVDLVVVLGGDLDTAGVVGVVLESLRAAKAPLFEACAVRVVADARYYGVG